MDISCRQFPNELVRIVQRIANSHFVALDLEFSGIHSHRNRGRAQKLTLQEVYEQTKEAAKRYQVLQVGLTIVEEDVSRALALLERARLGLTFIGVYIARPYNFHINPVPAKEDYHGLERIWSFQSGAVAFLLKNKFRFDLIFSEGIQYLSRKEEAHIRASWAVRDAERAAIEDLVLKVEDAALADHIHSSVGDWLSQPLVERRDYLNIPYIPPDSPEAYGVPSTLTRYQVRLTHQIIRKHYPDLKTVGRGGFVRITIRNDKEDAEEKLRQIRYRELDVIHAIEFRWLIEALCGGDISKIPDRYLLAAMPSNNRSEKDEARDTRYVDALQLRLNSRRRVLFGHNCFIDLVYLFAAFIGDLPEKVEDFQELIHALFPAVVDTKYMASLIKEFRFKSDLETVEKELRDESVPLLEVPPAFDKYVGQEWCHEAGYDSFITAKIAIKLSTRIARERRPAESIKPQLIVKAGETIIIDPSTVDENEDLKEEYVTPTESIADPDPFINVLASKLSAAFMSSAKPPLQSSPPPSETRLGGTLSTENREAPSTTNNDQTEEGGWRDETNNNSVLQLKDGSSSFSGKIASSTPATSTTAESADKKPAPARFHPKVKPTKNPLVHNNRFNVLDSLSEPTANLPPLPATSLTKGGKKESKNEEEDLLLLSDIQDANQQQHHHHPHSNIDDDNDPSQHPTQPLESSNDVDDLWPAPPKPPPMTARERAEKADEMAARGELMPRWDDRNGIWHVIGNRLAVAAAEEGLCQL